MQIKDAIVVLDPEILHVLTQALGTAILPLLWAHLAHSMGLPLEAPKQAQRGWSIAALQRGAQSLSPQHAALLGLFCRSACLAVQALLLLVAVGRDCCEAPQGSLQHCSAHGWPSDVSEPVATPCGLPWGSAGWGSAAPSLSPQDSSSCSQPWSISTEASCTWGLSQPVLGCAGCMYRRFWCWMTRTSMSARTCSAWASTAPSRQP